MGIGFPHTTTLAGDHPQRLVRAFGGTGKKQAWPDLCRAPAITHTKNKRVVDITRTWTRGTRENANELLTLTRGCRAFHTAVIEGVDGTFRERRASVTRTGRHAAARGETLGTARDLMGWTSNVCRPHQERCKPAHCGCPIPPALAAALTDPLWSLRERWCSNVAPAPWVHTTPVTSIRSRGRPRKPAAGEQTLPERPRGRPPTSIVAEVFAAARTAGAFTNEWGARQQVTERIKHEHPLCKGPYVSLSRPFTRGAAVAGVVAETARCFCGWTLYDHQERAAWQLVAGQPTMVVSSTGSGKTDDTQVCPWPNHDSPFVHSMRHTHGRDTRRQERPTRAVMGLYPSEGGKTSGIIHLGFSRGMGHRPRASEYMFPHPSPRIWQTRVTGSVGRQVEDTATMLLCGPSRAEVVFSLSGTSARVSL